MASSTPNIQCVWWVFYAFFPLDFSFARVPRKVWIGLEKIYFLAFEVYTIVTYTCTCTSTYVWVCALQMTKNHFLSILLKLSMELLWNWDPNKKKQKLPNHPMWILWELGPILKNELFSKILKKWKKITFLRMAPSSPIFILGGWVFYVFFLWNSALQGHH